MSSIITITFNPCIDKSISVPALIPDKKLHCTVEQLQPGGGGINVARVIKRLGLPVTAIYPSGGSTGVLLDELLKKEVVTTLTIPTTHPIRENIMLTETGTHKQYRLGMPGEPLTLQEWQACLRVISGTEDAAFIIVSGSIQDNAPRDLFRQIASIAREKQAKLIVDAAGETLQMAVRVGAWLIKPNLSELAELSGKKELNEYQVREEAHHLITSGHCSIVVVSMDARGAILVTADECYRAIPPIIKPQSSVGAGDSMVGGIVYSLSQGKTMQEALRMGVACGTAAIMNPGTSLCKPEDAGMLYNEIQIFPLATAACPD
ncbi:1-phosphofructokinase family hexose kinase [Paraflavitalea soli]|uniref:1-phosphofructokinase family hexose kinase n=1 Tax=Paraflavitalea soli TaxID=2315862 RepID=A0A3B7MHY6_9BACT|nr:1-phosphofructokinase family hexose kinase [Paraflavitalea soli]AXY74034.1 1-phosphofructokinase family hexose kinase [Paraflavitalea soli]